jgi:microcystin-dependent protein
MPIGLNHNTETIYTSQEMFMQIGSVFASARIDRPDGFLLCDGSTISRTTYSRLFNVIVPSRGTVTVTIASPGVVTEVAHDFQTGESVYLTTTGALPTGLTANTLYFVIMVTADTFRLATTYANAIAGTAINTTGTQSGTHAIFACPYGLGDGSTTFNIPDLRGAVPRGSGTSSGYTQNVTSILGTKQDDAFQSFRVHLESWSAETGDGVGNPRNQGYGLNGPYGDEIASTGRFSAHGSNGIPRNSNETRMKNLGVNFFIKF